MNFDGKQILSTFVKMEEGVAKYYAELAEVAPDEKSKALFLRLSLEEEKHQKMYAALLDKHAGEMDREFSEEEIEYTQSLIDENLTGKHSFDKNMKLKDSLELAEKMEKDGILFVHQMMSMYPDIAEKEMKIVLKEEKKHLQMVRERMNFGPTRSLGL
ncbi:MAG: ferritin family protein [Tissierellales bacterium]|jgi:rubrerythrin|nr:ferritin family protein [Tissierellales bacterium]MBN2827251.1 ferritin family protein [Tissierellales bacterium]